MYYLTKERNPIMSNVPDPVWSLITKEEHDTLAKTINDKAKADRLAAEEAAKPAQEYEKKIQAKLREMAIKELEKE